YPLHPFAGALAERLEFADPRRFIYTTIGNLAKDSRALGYDYGDPVDPDYSGPYSREGLVQSTPAATSSLHLGSAVPRTAVMAASQAEDELLVCFDGVRCTYDSYALDVFLNQDDPQPADVDAANPHYVGRLTRIGMGQKDDKGRCVTQGVKRMLDATRTASALGLTPGTPCRLALLVTELPGGRVLTPDEYRALPGSTARVDWCRSGWIKKPVAISVSHPASCCHAASRGTNELRPSP
ncbi:MAG: tyrosinase family protein, partial [Gammaproteobacteria bacterium]